MKRLTQKQSAGYDLKALNGQYCNNYCDEQSATTCRDCAIYQAIQKLARYEDTGLTTEQIMELKERDTASAPEPAPLGMDGMECAACGKTARPWDRFCGECGQRFWEDE